eukprot:RCo028211
MASRSTFVLKVLCRQLHALWSRADARALSASASFSRSFYVRMPNMGFCLCRIQHLQARIYFLARNLISGLCSIQSALRNFFCCFVCLCPPTLCLFSFSLSLLFCKLQCACFP